MYAYFYPAKTTDKGGLRLLHSAVLILKKKKKKLELIIFS